MITETAKYEITETGDIACNIGIVLEENKQYSDIDITTFLSQLIEKTTYNKFNMLVSEENEEMIDFSTEIGMHCEGVDSDSVLVNNEPADRLWFGTTRDDIVELLEYQKIEINN